MRSCMHKKLHFKRSHNGMWESDRFGGISMERSSCSWISNPWVFQESCFLNPVFWLVFAFNVYFHTLVAWLLFIRISPSSVYLLVRAVVVDDGACRMVLPHCYIIPFSFIHFMIPIFNNISTRVECLLNDIKL